MGALTDKLLAPDRRATVLADCLAVIDQEVASKSGLTGLAIKGAYKMVKAVGPNMIRDAMNGLLDDFTRRLEPFYDEHLSSGSTQPLAPYMVSRSKDVANALLGITDDRARRASGTIRKAYDQLRPTGEKHVQEAVPRIAAVIAKHAA